MKRILMVRLDRIGDLILTLPVDQVLPDTQVDWWIPKGLSFVTECAEPPRRAREETRDFSWAKLSRLVREIRLARYDAAIVFHAPWWVSAALWLASVPLRAGVKSQWHSFLFLNRAIRQKRSRAEHSELEYNFQLVEQALQTKLGRAQLKLTAPKLNKFDLQDYVVVHPGMGGSALNWPLQNYEALIRTLAKTRQVVITGTAADEPYLTPLRAPLANETRVMWLDQKLSGHELVAVLAHAQAIVAPSTGVLHVAASTGQPTLGLFSPVRVQQPKRWGPQGPRTETLMPLVDCPGEMRCLGPQCPHFDCMERISVDQVLARLPK